MLRTLYVPRNPLGTRFYFALGWKRTWIQVWRFELRWIDGVRL